MEENISYAIYPSLLDAYMRFARRDDDETLESLMNKINKVKTPQTEQQLKGIAFEKCVNDAIACLKNGYEGVDVEIQNDYGFDLELIRKIANKLKNATATQEYVSAIMPSHLGNIKLYGIIDYRFPEMIVDLKTTENYKMNKYKDNAQHPCYSLIDKLNDKPLKAFGYSVTDFKRYFQERYIPTDQMHRKFMANVFEFIAFLNHFERHITDRTVFGEDKKVLTI